MRKIYLSWLFFIGFYFLNAQSDSISPATSTSKRLHATPIKIEIALASGFPIGNFKTEIDRAAITGNRFGLSYHFKQSPFDLGFELGTYSYDHVRRHYDSNRHVQVTKNKIWLWGGTFCFERKTVHSRSFYLKGMLGWRRYYTKTFSKQKRFLGINWFDRDSDTRFDRKVLHSDWGIAYGGAVGIQFHLKTELASGFFIECGMNFSDTGDFYARDVEVNIQTEPLKNYSRQTAALSMLSLKIGVFGVAGYYR